MRTSLRLGLAAAVLMFGCESLQNAVADGDTRAITMHHLHTGEDISITYKINGRYDDAALQRLDWFLRDWREGKSIHMDPHLIDLVWEVNREVQGTQPVQIVCGFRDENTNSMLRRRSTGVAQHSQHVLGKAMDFFIPGVSLEKLRAAGLRLQRGGVGFYPSSGSPFVHLDVGGIRHWPRMTREQLVRVFPDGRTVHIPTDGHPLPGYALALADIERRGGQLGSASLAAGTRAGIVSAGIASDGERVGGEQPKSLLAALFGGFGKPEPGASPAAMATSESFERPSKPGRLAGSSIPLPKVRPAGAPMTVVASAPMPARAIAPAKTEVASASPTPAEVIRSRGYWVGVPDMPPSRAPVVLASFDSDRTGSIVRGLNQTSSPVMQVLAYAAVPEQMAWPPRQSLVTRWAGASTSIAGKAEPPKTLAPALAIDPWLDAVTITPSVRTYLSATQYGVRDLRSLRPLLEKPATTLAMTFSQEFPQNLTSERFTGPAVVFLSTVSFGDPSVKTAWLP